MTNSDNSADSDFSICLVGAGNMGGAMLSGWLQSGIAPDRITVVDPSPNETISAIMARHGLSATGEAPQDMVADVLVVAVKPQLMDAVLPRVAHLAGPQTVSVSVAAGTTIARLAADLGAGAVVRAMPNTPALLGRGITAACADAGTSELQRSRVHTLLAATGKVEWVEDEALIDAVTAVSGSGPAYAFLLAECMADAGIAEGLPEALAHRLARETIAGAGEMLSRLDESSEQLRRNVTSPNGTTAAALAVFMEEGGMRELVARAVHAARKRSQELSA